MRPSLALVAAPDQHSSARGEGELERFASRLGIEPVDRATDGDDVEGAELRSKILEPTLDEPHRDASALGCGPRGLDHARLGIDADDLAAIRRKANRQNAWPGADVEQALASIEAELFRDGGEKRRSIRRAGAFVIGDGGGEASHGNPSGVRWRSVQNHATAASTWRASTLKIDLSFN